MERKQSVPIVFIFQIFRGPCLYTSGKAVPECFVKIPGDFQKGPAGPFWSFQLGRVQGGEETEIFPSLVSFSLLLSFGQAKERMIVFLCETVKNRISSLVRMRSVSCWAVFVCVSFSLAGDAKKKQRYSPVFALAHAGPTGACVHDSNLPAGQIRTATAHSACALYPVMPDPLAALAQKVGSSNTDGHEKSTAGPLGLRCFSGAAGQIRTADLILTKDALYLLSYSSKVHAP